MSAAASRLELEKPLNQGYIPTGNETEPIEDEGVAVGKLTGITPDPLISTIAVDLDDVLSQTNQAVADCKSPSFYGMLTLTQLSRA